MSKYAIQLYSMRDIASQDLLAAIDAAGEMGWDGVEFAGFFGQPPEAVKERLARWNLTPVSSHVKFPLLWEDPGLQLPHPALHLPDQYSSGPAASRLPGNGGVAQGQKGQVRGLRPGRLHRELPGGRLRLPRRAYGGGRGLSGGPLQPGAAVHRRLFPLLRPAAHQGPGFLPRAGLRHRGPCGILLTSPDCPCCRTFPAAGAIFMTAGELPRSRPHPEQLRALKSAAIPPDDPFKRCKIPASHRSDPLTTTGISGIISYDV